MSSDPSPQEREAFSDWLLARWKEKEMLLEGYAQNGRFPADEGHHSEGGPVVGTTKGAGFIEAEVKLTHWFEILQIFSVLGAVAAVGVTFGIPEQWWNTFGSSAYINISGA
ncbi:MAG: hypothetical protein L6R42_008293 [Xanthoria sp. 1 TBL-2021]|nr:MAG: hypothetical protein L6R42_008293 [Xanthoria sp. 1 TBL-2021]